MQLNKDYEPEINFRDVFFHVLYRWRSILLITLISAVLLGGYQLITINKSAPSSTEELATEELEKKRLVDEKAKQVEELETYLNESVYIQLSSYGVWTASSKYIVKANPITLKEKNADYLNDPVDIILPLYTYPLSKVSQDELIQFFGVSRPEYVSELVTVETDTNDNTISVKVKGETKESAKRGLNFLCSRIESITNDHSGEGNYRLLNVGEDIVLVLDEDLAGRKASLEYTLDQTRRELQELSQDAERYEADGMNRLRKKQVTKYALIGLVISFFMSAFFYVLHYVLRGRLNSSNELTEKYNLPILGEIKKSSSIHNNRGLDKIIAKMELGKNYIDKETTYRNISALIVEQKNLKKFMLVSTLPEKAIFSVKKDLSTNIQDIDINVKGDFLTNSEAITHAIKANSIILVEEINRSENKKIERMAEMLMISQANVIGAIVI